MRKGIRYAIATAAFVSFTLPLELLLRRTVSR